MLASSNARPTIRRECGEAGERTHANHVLPSKLRLIPHSFRRKIDVPSHANGNQRVSSRETSLFPMLKRTNICSVGTGATNGFRTVALQFISPRIMHFNCDVNNGTKTSTGCLEWTHKTPQPNNHQNVGLYGGRHLVDLVTEGQSHILPRP